jgi:hypothetical protein
MAMENLAIAQHQNTLCYAIIRGGGYWFGFGGLNGEIMFIYNRQH